MSVHQLIQQEVKHLKRYRHRWFYLLLLPAISIIIPLTSGISNIPTPYYNNKLIDPLLIVIAVTAHLFYMLVLVRTGLFAVQSIGRELENGTWDTLQLANLSRPRLLWSKWRGVMRYVWRDHLIGVLPRFAFLVMFSVASYRQIYLNIETEFCRQAAGFMMPYCQRQLALLGLQGQLPLPAPYQLAFSLITLALLALAEAGLITALGIMSAFVVKRMAVQLTLLWGIRFGIFLVVAYGLVMLARYNMGTFQFNMVADYASFCDQGFDYPSAEECPTYYSLRNQQRIIETLQTGVTTLMDDGTLVQLNILNNSYSLRTATYVPTPVSLARNLASVAIGLMLYGVLTIVAMLLGIRFAAHQARE